MSAPRRDPALAPLPRPRAPQGVEPAARPATGRARALLDAVVAIGADLTLGAVPENVVRAAVGLVPARTAVLAVLGPDRQLRRVAAAQREGGPATVLEEAQARAAYARLLAAEPDGGTVRVPVTERGTALGALLLAADGQLQGALTEEDRDTVAALAAAAGVALGNARVLEEADRRRRWLEAAGEITSSLLGDADRDTELGLVARRAREVAEADIALIMLPFGRDELVVEVLAGTGDGDPCGLTGARMPLEGSLCGQVVLQGQAVVVDDPPLTGGEVRADVEIAQLPGTVLVTGATLLVPLGAAHDVRGVLAVARRPGAPNFSTIDVQLATTFANQAALALDRHRAQSDRAHLAVYEDRDRIARDLHDLVIQRLFATGLGLQGLSRTSDERTKARLAVAVDDLDATIRDIRTTIFELNRRVDSDDLRGQVRDVLAEAERALGYPARLQLRGPIAEGVPDEVRPHLLAVLRESMSNVARHSGADAVAVALTVDRGLTLVIEDNGSGLGERARGGNGLRNMRRRAEMFGGGMSVETREGGSGTRLEWRVPLG
ncbi:GAF domain-containing sensor histidine kinase [Motilibacter aurantiacus]|uniref:GAF domain-containing sensor histidine kinase n=1 Tax=Motilibacter aurantiacus TaxID=2714955 RepID=UPI00140E08C6|nr:GAF domain-containing protein [Motilibacter aurantiacus]NHC46291.1 GAF domain-containing protein [Motilibacter aurantiacus]